jgi:hypothetical protein
MVHNVGPFLILNSNFTIQYRAAVPKYRPKTVPPDVSRRRSQRYIVFKRELEA